MTRSSLVVGVGNGADKAKVYALEHRMAADGANHRAGDSIELLPHRVHEWRAEADAQAEPG